LRKSGLLEKQILKVCTSRKEALALERRLIMAFRKHPLCMNETQREYPVPPPAPPGLEWPPQFNDTDYWHKRGGIIAYLENMWLPFIIRKTVDMRFLRLYYPSAAEAIYAYRTARTGSERGRRQLPDNLRIPRELGRL